MFMFDKSKIIIRCLKRSDRRVSSPAGRSYLRLDMHQSIADLDSSVFIGDRTRNDIGDEYAVITGERGRR